MYKQKQLKLSTEQSCNSRVGESLGIGFRKNINVMFATVSEYCAVISDAKNFWTVKKKIVLFVSLLNS